MNKKQVILLMVDTQRQDMLSCYDKHSAKTHALDNLAEEGTLYTNGFTCQPVCGPARSALFTGLYPHSNGMIANCMQLGKNIKNAAEWLAPHGIDCAYIGKWHLDGGDYFGYGKCPDGYNSEYWYDMRNFLDELTPKERILSRKNMGLRNDDPSEESTFAHRCSNRAIDYLEKYKDKDFFLTLSLDEPHDPSICPRRFFKELDKQKFKFHRTPNVKAKLKGKPDYQKVWAKKFKSLPFYAMRMGSKSMFACNLFCDYELGRVLDKIKELQLDPMIIYTSDHGDMFLSHNIMGKGCVMYNEIVKIPFIIKGGGFNKSINSTPVSHIDMLPTIMEYFNVKVPSMLQGQPLQKVSKNVERDILIEFTRYETDHDGFMGYQPVRCLTNGKYKLVINLLCGDEFYDLEKDPYEKNNLILSKEYSHIRDAFHDRLIKQMDETRDVYRGYYWLCRPWRKGVKASFDNSGMTRQLQEDDFTQLDYNTGMPMKSSTRKK